MPDNDEPWPWSSSFQEALDRSDDAQGIQYEGYGRCIYCLGEHEVLTDEHIIPFSLGGNAEIARASCKQCQETVDPIDRHLGRTLFGPHRVHTRIQTRRPGDRPTTLPAEFIRGDERVKVELPIDEHPYTLTMPAWDAAKFFTGTHGEGEFRNVSAHCYHWIPPTIMETMGRLESDGLTIETNLPKTFRLDYFARSIAKIAYCHAVIRYGLDAFRASRIQDVILGKDALIPYFVGTSPGPPPPPFKGALHFVGFQELALPDKKWRLLVVTVRLFANRAAGPIGLPIYHVVVGLLPKATWKQPDR